VKIGEKMGILKKMFCAEKEDRQLRFEISDEEYEELIERARKIDAAQRERMEYLKKHDKKEYKRIMTMKKFSCGL
jgi:hypothetical protein